MARRTLTTRSPRRRSPAPVWSQRLLLAALLGCLALLVSSSPALATSCQASGPVAGSYSVTVCIAAPGEGATLTGAVAVTATATPSGTSPGVQRMVFYLGGQYLLTDYQAPFTFTLHSERFVDGATSLEVEALMRDGFTSTRASIPVTLQNGVLNPPPLQTGFAPTAGTTPAPGRPFVLAVTGDGAGGEQNSANVATLVSSWSPNLFAYVGDVYEKGSRAEFDNWYDGSGFFGQFAAITNPTVGNHEYDNGQAPGYFDYWRSPPHYYSVDAAGWHIVSLDSNTQFNQTAPGTPQYEWLQSDLAASPSPCKLVYFHHPLYNVGPEGAAQRMSSIWSLLAAQGVDIVLTGHDHNYQRWVRLDGAGNPSASGIVQFVVGGGGHGIQQFVSSDPRLAKGFDTPPQAFGALRLTLNGQGAGFKYVNTAGSTLDSGSIACTTAADTTPPATPTGLSANVAGPHRVDLTWSEPVDDVGVTGYDVYRNGSLLARIGATSSYSDVTVASELTYAYQVRARDAAGNTSTPSSTVSVTTPAGEAGVFADNFETGNLSSWTSVTGVVAQQQHVFSGSWAARATSSGPATWAYKTLPTTYADLYYRIRFKVVSQATTANLLKFRTSTGSSIIGYYLTSTGKLSYRNDVAGASTSSTTVVSAGAWHTLQSHVVLNGASSQTETWFDDVKVPALSKTESLGTAQIGRVQIGENSADRVYDIAFDTVLVDTSFIPTDTSAPATPANAVATPVSATAITLTWAPSTDNVGVTGYTVYRDGELLAGLPPSSTSYADTSLEPSSEHTYAVDAFDAAGNHSPQSAPASATTPSDTTPPSTPSSLAVTGVSVGEVDLSWAPSTDDVGVTGYTIYRNGTALGTVEAGVQGYVDNTVSPSTTYTYTVDAFDAADNHSSASSPAQATTPGPPDASPPSKPTGLAATVVGSTRVDLSWSASTDDVGVTGYTVYRDGSQIGTVDGSTLAYSDTTAAPGHAYAYTVDAFDAAGNHSAQSDPAAASTGGDTTPPATPTGLTAAAVGPTTVNLAWSASTDNVAVTGYTIYRNGTELATVGGGTLGYSDTSASPSTTYSYTVDAFDAASNHSARSDAASATTPPPFLFADDFESGNLGSWTSVAGLVVQQQEVFSGSWAARATTTGPASWAYKSLPSTQTSVYYRIRFKVLSQSTTANLLKFRTATGSSLLGVYVGSNGKLSYRNDVAGQSTTSPTQVTTGTWHTLQVHIVVNGAAGQTETWLDGVKVSQLSKTESLGTTPVGRVQLGENSADRVYDVAYDTVAVDTSFIADS